ncbi:hypothetical protein GPECTOR_11g263 [Gonium pectorale]|uniref:EF-hand domain-containing protein n=1 Tax=Gonium pectorale TaxID=33097 RepID=A0A150GPR5_GONPE|nr:hypothetical protein GPECTOR_11g263 [Gonium pectorale]|eukprot:KXZ51823.1 hypothetical protein GPECTOR_11g263 [Gonium pectorale]
MASLFKRLKARTNQLPKPAPLGAIPSVPLEQVVTRRDIRELSPEEQARVCNAIEKMMEAGWAADSRNNIGGWDQERSPSEYFRLARYHGWDKSFCVHGRETFPGWHRAYLVDFERTLQAADRALGGDGRIALPYWGWDAGAVNGQLFPQIIRERFAVLKPGLIPEVANSQLNPSNGYRIVPNDQVLAKGMTSMKISDQVRRALSQWEHPRAASTAADNADSVETPHNSLHVLCGWPMTSVSFAAFHPIFFLHHCNVDRLYEAYLRKDMANAGDGENAPWNEFSKSLYGGELRPFRHPATGEWFMPKHTFKIEAIGYRYDKLPAIPPQRLTEPPFLARFEDINPVTLAGRSIALHVFVVGPADPGADFTPPDDVDAFDEVPQYGGMTGVFGSKEGECENCKTRDPIVVEVDVTDCLRKQGLSRHAARLSVVAVDMNTGEHVSPEEVGIPQPKLAGPFFEDKEAMLGRKDGPQAASTEEAGEVAQLQLYLKKYGWYSGEVDGFFGPATEEAVRKYQQFFGLKVDGIAGPVTRSLMMMARMDDKADEADIDDRAAYAPGSVVRWWAGDCPGYLDEEVVRDEVAAVMAEWATAVPLSFLEVDSAQEADLVISWSNRSRDNVFRFDGPGGALAYAVPYGGPGSPGTITLDAAEQWLLQPAAAKPGAFYIMPVLLHEIGHALGLTHSSTSDDVMSPFYVPDQLKLTDGDRNRAAAIYPLDGAAAQLFSVLDQDGDGMLSREEFLTALCNRGSARLERPEAEALFDEADSTGEGALAPQQFVVLMARLFFG